MTSYTQGIHDDVTVSMKKPSGFKLVIRIILAAIVFAGLSVVMTIIALNILAPPS